MVTMVHIQLLLLFILVNAVAIYSKTIEEGKKDIDQGISQRELKKIVKKIEEDVLEKVKNDVAKKYADEQNAENIKPDEDDDEGLRSGSKQKGINDVEKASNDVDGCLGNPCDALHGVCTNTPEGFKCECQPGFRLLRNKRTCKDINECKTDNGGCSQKCKNEAGSFSCQCKKGFVLGSDEKTCEDVDECLKKPCKNGVCTNTDGSFKCECQTGYRLLGNKKTCKDINECKTDNGGCSQLCKNEAGSFHCWCKKGFLLGSDKKTCNDADECLANPCDPNHGVCTNTPGSFKCECQSGYRLLGNKRTCKAISQSSTSSCGDTYEKVGCFHDMIFPTRPYPFQLLNRRDPHNPTWDGVTINWRKYPASLRGLACKCARLAKKAGYEYFGLQHYGECWSGPSVVFYRDGGSPNCVGGDFQRCVDSDSTECIGKGGTNYIYRVKGSNDEKKSDANERISERELKKIVADIEEDILEKVEDEFANGYADENDDITELSQERKKNGKFPNQDDDPSDIADIEYENR